MSWPQCNLTLTLISSLLPAVTLLKRQVQAAWRNHSLAIASIGGGYLGVYNFGVGDQLVKMGVLEHLKSTAAGVGSGAMEALLGAANYNFNQLSSHWNLLKQLCRDNQNCLTTFDAMPAKLFGATLEVLGGKKAFEPIIRQKNLLYIALYVGNDSCRGAQGAQLNSSSPPAKPLLVSDFRDIEDLAQTARAAIYTPLVSGPALTTTWRGQPACNAYSGAGTPHPCPPGVGYCIKVSPYPYPDDSSTTVSTAYTRALTLLASGTASTLEDLVGSTLKRASDAKPSSLESVFNILQGRPNMLGLGPIDIAPNIFYKIPVPNLQNWYDVILATPTEETATFLWDLGHMDALAWAKAMGVGNISAGVTWMKWPGG